MVSWVNAMCFDVLSESTLSQKKVNKPAETRILILQSNAKPIR